MAKKDNKALGVLLIGGALLYALSREAEAPPEPSVPIEAAASISVVIEDTAGNPIKHSSPLVLYIGKSYKLKVVVFNKSTLGGEPCEATLTVVRRIVVPSNGGITAIFPEKRITYAFPPNKYIGFTSSIPRITNESLIGVRGQAAAWVESPQGEQIALAHSEVFTIEGTEYAASVSASVF